MRISRSNRPYAYLMLIAVCLADCGTYPEKSNTEKESVPAKASPSTSASENTGDEDSSDADFKVEIPVKVINSQNFVIGSGFALSAVADGYSISISECQSGLTATVTKVTHSATLYKYDKGCLAKLTSFTYKDVTFTPSLVAGQGFSNWLAGDSATFVDTEDAGNTMHVEVIESLSPVIDSLDIISYRFSKIAEGSSNSGLLHATVDSGTPLPGAVQAAPDFTIYQTTLAGVDSQGVGQFQFILECHIIMTATICDNIDLENINYLLIENTGVDPDLTEAENLFSTLTPKAVDPVLDIIAPGTNSITNGGFNTKSGISILTGPDNLATKPHMLLIIQAVGTDNSYEYFHVDIAVSS